MKTNFSTKQIFTFYFRIGSQRFSNACRLFEFINILKAKCNEDKQIKALNTKRKAAHRQLFKRQQSHQKTIESLIFH
jgi:hypothetical protein